MDDYLLRSIALLFWYFNRRAARSDTRDFVEIDDYIFDFAIMNYPFPAEGS